MRSILLALGVVACAVLPCAARSAHAQEAQPLAAAQPTERSPLAAAALETLVPVLGHIYAGDWRRGISPALVYAGGVAAFAYAYNECTDCEFLLIGGAVAWLGGRVWGIVSAARTAQERNERVRALPPIGVRLQPGAVQLGAWLQF